MSIKIGEVVATMTNAAKSSLKEDWPKVRDYAQPEFRRLARVLEDIVKKAAKGAISANEAKSLLRIHRNTVLTVMLAVEGMGIIAAEKAINAALKAVADIVNKALPFKLL
jgi:hypothetical protein